MFNFPLPDHVHPDYPGPKPMVKYLGALIVDPASPARKPGERSVPGYDPKAHCDQWMDEDASAVDRTYLHRGIFAEI